MKPSVIPQGGRALSPEEYAALREDMERIVTSSHLFKSLDDHGRDEVLESGYVTRFQAGTKMLQQGEAGDTMFLVMTGTIRVQSEEPGRTIHLAELGRGACVGEVSVLSEAPRSATVVALTDVTAVAFARHRIQRILDDYPKVRKVLESLVESRAKDTIEKIVGT